MKKIILLALLLNSLSVWSQSSLEKTFKNGDQVIKLNISNFIKMVDLSYNDWEIAVKNLGYEHIKTEGQFEDFQKGSYDKKNSHWIGKARIKPQINFISYGNEDKSDINRLIEELKNYYLKDIETGEMVFAVPYGNYNYQFVIQRKNTFSDVIVVSRFPKNES
jgi:hypothetical protein